MTKSQNTKNEQQKDLCITSEQLTEQWKKGELPYGRYYVELAYNGNSIIMAEYWWDKTLTLDDHEYSREEVKRILAPVPSYEEWQAKLEENAQLKELLKECKKMLMSSNYENMAQYHEVLELRDKINKIIGEK